VTTTYSIEVFHLDRDAWVAILAQAVAEELLDIGLHRTVSVVVTESTPATAGPVVGVYLGSVTAANNVTVGDRLTSALAAGTVIVPVVESLAEFIANVHPSLAFANGFEWSTRRILGNWLESFWKI